MTCRARAGTLHWWQRWDLCLTMDKYDKYNPDEETIEAWLKGTGRSEEVEISRNITFSEKILIESCGI